MVQNGGDVKLRQILVTLRIWWEKLWRIVSLSSSIKTCHSHTMLNLKPQSFVLSSCVALNNSVRVCSVKCGEGITLRMTRI